MRAHGFYATLQTSINHILCGSKTYISRGKKKNLHPVLTLTTQKYKCHPPGMERLPPAARSSCSHVGSKAVLHEGWTLGQSCGGFLRGGDLLLVRRLVDLHGRAGAHQVLVAVDVVDS